MDYAAFQSTLAQLARHIEYLHGHIRNIAYDVYISDIQNAHEDIDLDILMFRKAEMRMYITQLNDANLRYYQLRSNYPEHCIEIELDAVDRNANPDGLASWELYDQFQ